MISINHGDCREVLKTCAEAEMLFDACVTDPPYHLASIVKRFGAEGAAPAQHGTDGAYARASKGFMGQVWDGGDISYQPATWKAVYNVLKPGAHLAVFGGTKSFHRIACAVEDAGFELRDTLMWIFGTGMPKSHAVSNGISKSTADYEADQWDGWGTALKPAFEPIILARKQIEGTVAQNVMKYGTGAINIDGCRIDAKGALGRWPANLIHDGSDEVLALFPDSKGQLAKARTDGSPQGNRVYGALAHVTSNPEPRNDSGSAARFFYSAKANKADRAGSEHPTVKPISLIQYLCKLVTPPKGRILDPFAGSGTLAAAAYAEGFDAFLIEQSKQYIDDIKRRVEGLK